MNEKRDKENPGDINLIKCLDCGQFMGALEIHYHKRKDGFVYETSSNWLITLRGKSCQ